MFILGKALWFALTPSNSLTLLAFFGTIAGCVRRFSRKGLLIGALGAAGLLLCGVSPVAYWLATPLETRFRRQAPLPEHVTGFIVLGGGLRPYDTEEVHALSLNDAGERLVALGDLARRYPSAKIVVSGRPRPFRSRRRARGRPHPPLRRDARRRSFAHHGREPFALDL